MLLDPVISQFLDEAVVALASVNDPGLSVAQMRERADSIGASLHQMVAEPGPAVREIRDYTVEVDGGEIRLRCYFPDGDGPHSCHVVLHGGGWWQGSIDDWISDVQARERCAGSGSVVVVVDYRLAPEHPFPTPLNDCRAAWLWVLSQIDTLGIDADKISLGGVSAGGNLAAALCLLLRDRGEVLPSFQLLEAPVVDFSFDHPSMQEFGKEFGMDEAGFGALIGMYVPDPADRLNPYAAPLLAADLSGMPPTHIMTGEYDPLRDGAELFGERLRTSDVAVTVTRHGGHVHTSPVMTAVLEIARTWRAEVLEVLGRVATSEPITVLTEAAS